MNSIADAASDHTDRGMRFRSVPKAQVYHYWPEGNCHCWRHGGLRLPRMNGGYANFGIFRSTEKVKRLNLVCISCLIFVMLIILR